MIEEAAPVDVVVVVVDPDELLDDGLELVEDEVLVLNTVDEDDDELV